MKRIGKVRFEISEEAARSGLGVDGVWGGWGGGTRVRFGRGDS